LSLAIPVPEAAAQLWALCGDLRDTAAGTRCRRASAVPCPILSGSAVEVDLRSPERASVLWPVATEWLKISAMLRPGPVLCCAEPPW
jgi:hypothetical protein